MEKEAAAQLRATLSQDPGNLSQVPGNLSQDPGNLSQDAGDLPQEEDDMDTMMASLADPDSEKYYTIYIHLYNIQITVL